MRRSVRSAWRPASQPSPLLRAGWISMLLLESLQNAMQPPGSRTHRPSSRWFVYPHPPRPPRRPPHRPAPLPALPRVQLPRPPRLQQAPPPCPPCPPCRPGLLRRLHLQTACKAIWAIDVILQPKSEEGDDVESHGLVAQHRLGGGRGQDLGDLKHAVAPAPEPGGSACCYWNGYTSSATTRLKDSHVVPALLERLYER